MIGKGKKFCLINNNNIHLYLYLFTSAQFNSKIDASILLILLFACSGIVS